MISSNMNKSKALFGQISQKSSHATSNPASQTKTDRVDIRFGRHANDPSELYSEPFEIVHRYKLLETLTSLLLT